jgi:redox-sensitive bicupin YhaK (pirin superfamily)
MKYSINKSTSRGGADHGWLQAKHSFSFAQFYNEKMIHFAMNEGLHLPSSFDP